MRRSIVVPLALALAACAPDVAPTGPRPARPEDAGPPRDAAPPVDAQIDAAPQLDPRADPFQIDPRPTEVRVPAGGSTFIDVEISRLPGFVAPVVVGARGLPPGIHFTRAIGRSDAASVRVTLAADQDAPTGPTPFMLTAEASGWLHRARITVEVDR